MMREREDAMPACDLVPDVLRDLTISRLVEEHAWSSTRK
jgi:hypothetical protein